MSGALLQLSSVKKSFGAVRALKGVSFDLQAGEVHALLGENGAGKSTLIKIITGAHQPDGGSIEIGGERAEKLSPATARKLGIACIYQQPALFPDLTVAENIALRLQSSKSFSRVNWNLRRDKAQKLLRRIGAEFSAGAEVRSLSMPEQQLVEIACALGAGARIVIMDEPTASLTQKETHLLFAVVRELRASGAGVIYISHRLEEIFQLADRVTVLRDGESVGTKFVKPVELERSLDQPAPVMGIKIPGNQFLAATLGLSRRIAHGWARKNIVGKYRNAPTNWDIEVGNNGIKKALSQPRIFAHEHLEAIAAIPEMLRTARLRQSRPDRAGDPNIKAIHIFEAPLRVGAKDFQTKITVKETSEGKRFYDHSLLEIKGPAGTSLDDAPKDSAPQGPQTGAVLKPTAPASKVKSARGQPVGAPREITESSVTESELIKMMVGREVSQIYPAAENEPGEIALAVKNLACAAGGIKSVSLEIRAGEILGLAGLVGAGRTELARILFGITPADAGEIFLRGQKIEIRSPQEAIAHGIAYVPEDRRRHGVILEMPIAQNMTMAIHRKIFPGTWLRFGAEKQLALEFIRNLAVKTSGPDASGNSLSGGNQQKVSLARWLATKPKFLILDEPTQGVDVGAKSEIHKIIRDLAKNGLAVLMISSDLPEILGMSDRIAVMREGTIAAMLSGKSDAQKVMAAALGQKGADE